MTTPRPGHDIPDEFAGADVATPSDPAIPVIPGFRVDEVIGHGPRGSVFKAWNGSFSVALKVHHPDVSWS